MLSCILLTSKASMTVFSPEMLKNANDTFLLVDCYFPGAVQKQHKIILMKGAVWEKCRVLNAIALPALATSPHPSSLMEQQYGLLTPASSRFLPEVLACLQTRRQPALLSFLSWHLSWMHVYFDCSIQKTIHIIPGLISSDGSEGSQLPPLYFKLISAPHRINLQMSPHGRVWFLFSPQLPNTLNVQRLYGITFSPAAPQSDGFKLIFTASVRRDTQTKTMLRLPRACSSSADAKQICFPGIQLTLNNAA